MKTWFVYYTDMLIDTVQYAEHITAIEIYEKLVGVGYPSTIYLV